MNNLIKQIVESRFNFNIDIEDEYNKNSNNKYYGSYGNESYSIKI